MKKFEKPQIECEEIDLKENYARFTCKPLERGYGLTLGNSFRRILLSSLPGAAISKIKIDGVMHEFTTIPNVVEDVLELILNFKEVRLSTICLMLSSSITVTVAAFLPISYSYCVTSILAVLSIPLMEIMDWSTSFMGSK